MTLFDKIYMAANNYPVIHNYLRNELEHGFSNHRSNWETEMHHVNVFLNRLIINRYDRLDNQERDTLRTATRKARRVLDDVCDERYIDDWVCDLREDYFPVLNDVWH